MPNYFYPNFKMKLFKSSREEVRLVGENNYRRLLATYTCLLLISLFALWPIAKSSVASLLGVLGLLIGAAILIRWTVFSAVRHPHYMREELHFCEAKLWQKISVGHSANGQQELSYPLAVYTHDRHFRFYEQQRQEPLFEFSLDYVDKDPELLTKIASCLEVEIDFRAQHHRAEKYLLYPKQMANATKFSAIKHGGRSAFSSPNNFFQLYINLAGELSYVWSGEELVRLVPKRQELLTEPSLSRSLDLLDTYKYQCHHYLRRIGDPKDRYLEVSVYLHCNRHFSVLLFRRLLPAFSANHQRVLDILEDLKVFEQDLLARLEELHAREDYLEAPERIERFTKITK